MDRVPSVDVHPANSYRPFASFLEAFLQWYLVVHAMLLELLHLLFTDGLIEGDVASRVREGGRLGETLLAQNGVDQRRLSRVGAYGGAS